MFYITIINWLISFTNKFILHYPSLDMDEIGTNNPTNEYITEGLAKILSDSQAFYNPVQQFNRDLSIVVIATFNKLYRKDLSKKTNELPVLSNVGANDENGLVILEALSATGLRSIRYAKEIKGIKKIIANDISKQSVESIERNVKHNKVENLVVANCEDATTYMYLSTSPNKRFDVIDLDPYGSPTRFLDAAIQSLSDGGLLLVTATDMAVLAGNSPESCYVKYGSVPLKTKACHEMALRILLRSIESTSTRYGRYIQPLLSISADFYIRVFLRIFTSPLVCKQSSSKQSMVYQCNGCDSFTLQPLGIVKHNVTASQIKYSLPIGPKINSLCEHCSHRHHMGGPIWSNPIHDFSFVNELLQTISESQYNNMATYSRILGVLNVVEEELLDVPLYYAIEKMCSILRLEVIPMLKLRSALLYADYKVSFSHACKSSVKTNAPVSVLWDILRCWSKTHPINTKHLIEGSVLKNILDKPAEKEYNLTDMHPLANPESRKHSLVRFPENPTRHWGPGTRAKFMISNEKMSKSYLNQNKNKKRQQDSSDNVKINKYSKKE